MPLHRLRDAILRYCGTECTRYPRTIVAACILVAALSVFYGFTSLEFMTERNQLVSQDDDYNLRFLDLREEFGEEEDIVIPITGAEPEVLRDFAEALARRLRTHSTVLEQIFYRTDLASLRNKAFYYLEQEDLESLEAQLEEMAPFVQEFTEDPGFQQLLDMTLTEMDRALLEGGRSEGMAGFEPSLLTGLFDYLNGLVREDPGTELDLEKWFAGQDREMDRLYNYSTDRRFLFMTVRPIHQSSAFHPALPAVEAIRAELDALRPEFPGVEAGVTGNPVLAADEMVASTWDSIRASVLSLLGVTILFALFFGRMTEPVIAVLTLLVGICWSVGFTTLTIGHLNLLSVVFSIILIGLGIDFSVHLIFRLQEESQEGRPLDRVIIAAVEGAGPGLITGGITTSISFATAWFTNFRGIAELGVIAGSGVFLCLVTALVLLPALLKIRRHVLVRPKGLSRLRPRRAAVDEPAFHPILVFLVAIVFAALGVDAASKSLDYDDNLLKLQPEGLPAVEWEHRILREAGQSTWYGALVVDSIAEARKQRAIIERLPVVSHVQDVTDLLPENQQQRREQLRDVAAVVEDWPEQIPAQPPVNATAVRDKVKLLNTKLGLVHVLGRNREEVPVEELMALRAQVQRFLEGMDALEPERAVVLLSQGQETFLGQFEKLLRFLHTAANAEPITEEDIPASLRDRFIGETGRYILRIYPAEDIWESEPRERFVTKLRAVSREVTGSPLQVYESSILMREGYERAGLYALIAILILVFIDFRNIRATLLVMVPLFFGATWTVGIMAWQGIPFNLANLLALPLILGIGVDNGVHMVHRFRQEGEPASLVSGSTGRAVVLCSLTSMIGFGALAFAHHQGIASLGTVLFVGIGSCLLASITVLPALLHICTIQKWRV